MLHQKIGLTIALTYLQTGEQDRPIDQAISKATSWTGKTYKSKTKRKTMVFITSEILKQLLIQNLTTLAKIEKTFEDAYATSNKPFVEVFDDLLSSSVPNGLLEVSNSTCELKEVAIADKMFGYSLLLPQDHPRRFSAATFLASYLPIFQDYYNMMATYGLRATTCKKFFKQKHDKARGMLLLMVEKLNLTTKPLFFHEIPMIFSYFPFEETYLGRTPDRMGYRNNAIMSKCFRNIANFSMGDKYYQNRHDHRKLVNGEDR